MISDLRGVRRAAVAASSRPGLGYLGNEDRERQKQMLKDKTAPMGFGSTRHIEAGGCLSERLLVRAPAPAPEGAPEVLPISGKAGAENGRDRAIPGCAKAWLARQRQA